MQNQQIARERSDAMRLRLNFARLPGPRIVLLGVGVIAFAIDLFVRPVSLVGLALILLATLPWTIQAWAERNATAPTSSSERAAGENRQVAPRKPVAERIADPAGATMIAPGRPPAAGDEARREQPRPPRDDRPQPAAPRRSDAPHAAATYPRTG